MIEDGGTEETDLEAEEAEAARRSPGESVAGDPGV